VVSSRRSALRGIRNPVSLHKLISNATPTMPAAQRDAAEQADRTTPFLSSRIGYERKILGW
jgi:hypothetical protein